MLRTRLALLLAATTAAALAAPASAASSDPLLCTLSDDRITESSGVVVSSTSDRRLFTHNNSGDDARFFALDDRCRTTATYALKGVDANDWEDMTRGPDEDGDPALWFGDIGDNAMVREAVAVYGVAEPRPGRAGGETQEVASTAYRMRYEDGAHDAETLLADPRTQRRPRGRPHLHRRLRVGGRRRPRVRADADRPRAR